MLRLVPAALQGVARRRASTSTSSRSATRASASCNRLGGNIVSSVVQLGDRPRLDRLVGPVKVLMDKYIDGSVDEVHMFYTNFVNTMKQEPRARSHRADSRSSSARRAARCARHDSPTARGTTSTSPTRASCSTA